MGSPPPTRFYLVGQLTSAVPSDSSNLARDEIFWFCDRFWEAAISYPCWKVLCSTTTNKIKAVLRATFLQNVQMWQWYSCYSDKTWMTIFCSISAAVAPVLRCPSQGWKLSLQGGSLLSTWPPKSSSWRWCWGWWKWWSWWLFKYYQVLLALLFWIPPSV